MASSSNSLSLLSHCLKFNRSNWQDFKKDLKVFLGIEGLWEIVCGDEDRPEPKAAQAAWLKSNQCAYAYIYFLILPSLYNPIADLDLGSDAWTKLCKKFETDKVTLPLMLHQHLYSLHHDTKDLVSTFINAVWTVKRQLSSIGHPILDDETEDIIILGLHKLFVPIRSALLAQKTQPMLTEIIDAVEAFEASKRVATHAHLEPVISYGDSAMYTSVSKQTHTPTDPSDFDWGNTACRPNTCDRCRRIGHPTARCFADMSCDIHSAMLEAHLCYTNDNTIDSATSVAPGNDDELFAFISHVLPSSSLPSSPLLFAPSPTIPAQLPTTTPLHNALKIRNERVYIGSQVKGKRKKKGPDSYSPTISPHSFFFSSHFRFLPLLITTLILVSSLFPFYHLRYFLTSFTHFIYNFISSYFIFFALFFLLEGVC
jgi:hypothetical protein